MRCASQRLILLSFQTIFFVSVFLLPFALMGQQLELFTIRNNDLYWSNTYIYEGDSDSLRREVVQMLKSKFYTFNVVRNETGYNGELRHYTVDCKRYGRHYATTPGIYWEGEWSGKFIVDVTTHAYRVTVYALYAEKMQKTPPYHRMDKIVGGRFIDKVTTNDRTRFRKSEQANVALMSASLKDEFDISRTVIPQGQD